jgi:predicted permease
MAHLLAQTLVLSLGAVALALPLAQGMIGATDALFRASAEDGPPHWMRFDLDAPLVAAAVAAAVVTALLTGILPALRAGAASGQTLHQGGRVASGSAFVRVSRLLVVGEIALSCVLLIAAATIVQSIRDLERFDLGMRTDGVLTARIGLFEGKYPDDTAIRAYAAALLRALRADPAVVDATLSSSLPGLMGENVDVLPPGVPMPPGGLPNPGHSAVDAGFFATMGATLVAGRAFTDADRADAAPVMIVDETFVRRFVPDGRAVGRAFVVDPLDETPVTATVVGVVRPIQMEDVDDAIEPAVLTPFAQRPARFFSVLVRTRGAPAAFGERLRAIVGALDADTPAYWIRTYDDVLREATFGERVLVRVFGGFGLVALLLAAAGLYGVVAFSVAQRTREIGVRRALGESDGSVLATVGARSAVQVLAGLALGALGGVPFARLLAASINQPVDGAVAGWLAVIGLLALVAAVAVLVPARRALQVDPIVALRHE